MRALRSLHEMSCLARCAGADLGAATLCHPCAFVVGLVAAAPQGAAPQGAAPQGAAGCSAAPCACSLSGAGCHRDKAHSISNGNQGVEFFSLPIVCNTARISRGCLCHGGTRCLHVPVSHLNFTCNHGLQLLLYKLQHATHCTAVSLGLSTARCSEHRAIPSCCMRCSMRCPPLGLT